MGMESDDRQKTTVSSESYSPKSKINSQVSLTPQMSQTFFFFFNLELKSFLFPKNTDKEQKLWEL